MPLVSRWLSRPGGEGRLSIPARYPLLPPGPRVEDHPNHCSPLTHPNKPSQRCVTVLVFLPSSGRLCKLARPTNKQPGRTSGRFGSISCYMRHVNVHETTKQFVWIIPKTSWRGASLDSTAVHVCRPWDGTAPEWRGPMDHGTKYVAAAGVGPAPPVRIVPILPMPLPPISPLPGPRPPKLL